MVLDRKYHAGGRNTFSNQIMAELETITYPQTAQEIVAQFPPNIFSADLRRLIVNAIDMDRQRAREWLLQKKDANL